MAYVMMAIPAELVPAVTTFLEGQETASLPGGLSRVSEEEAKAGFVHGWNRSLVQRAYKESADQMRRLLEFLAHHPNQEVSSYELADAIEAKFGWNTVAGMLGAFGRRCVNRYGRLEPMWDYRYDAEGRILITLPIGPAEAIQSAT
jgi:hypothetical protein